MIRGILVAFGLLFIAACGPIYVAPGANTPLFSKAGELHLASHIDMATLETDAQVAFSPVNHIGLIGGISVLPKLGTEESRHYYGEMGVGAFFPFGPGRFEIFAGGGMGRTWGSLEEVVGDNWDSGRANFSKLFVQTNVGMSSKLVDFGLTVRVASLNFDYLESATNQSELGMDAIFIEPIAFARLGWDMIKFEVQVGRIIPVDEHALLAYVPFRFSFGLHLSFDLFE